MSNTITAIILTKDEEKHIARCIKSLTSFVNEIWEIDSFSTDKTLEIAEELVAKTVKYPFENQAQQFNWSIRNCEIAGDWIWRVDADEYISEDLEKKVSKAIETIITSGKTIYVDGDQTDENLNDFWYRFLVDAKVYEIKKKFGFNDGKVKKYLIDTGAKWSKKIRRGNDATLLIQPLCISLYEERRTYAA